MARNFLTNVPTQLPSSDGLYLSMPESSSDYLLTIMPGGAAGGVLGIRAKSRPGRVVRITAADNGWNLTASGVPSDGQFQAKSGLSQLNLDKNQTVLLQQQASGSWLVIETTGVWA